MYNPHNITKEFEKALCEYAGSKYAVTTNSCTMAILLAVKWCIDARWAAISAFQQKQRENGESVDGYWLDPMEITIPKKTYVSVPMSIIHAGGRPKFRDEDWVGEYQLIPYPIFDSARWFTSGMYRSNEFQCVSFHASKILGDTQGGAILHDNDEADVWFRKARFDGRTEGVPPKDDNFDMIGWHCYMSPDVAARLLWKLSVLPKHNPPLPNDDYPDLSKYEVFK
jgi:dTDP-4-amino-4,6-dideoxygalactose transaminase